MRRRFSGRARALCVTFAVIGACALAPRAAFAVPKNKPHAAAARKPTQNKTKKAVAAIALTDDAANADKVAAERPAEADPGAVKSAGTGSKTATAAGAGAQATVKEDKAGVKTYKFGTVEVEGRMKSPQIIYFLRRVRAEFDAEALGHRSFMRELSDTRNRSALR